MFNIFIDSKIYNFELIIAININIFEMSTI